VATGRAYAPFGMARRPTAVAAVILALAGACSGGGDEAQPLATPPTSAGVGTAGEPGTTPGDPVTTAVAATPRLRAVELAGFRAPIAAAVRDGDDTLYVAEKAGRVRALRNGAVDPTPVLDLSGQVSGGNEQGLLGLAFSPPGDRLYVDYTDTAGDTSVVEYVFVQGRADPSTARRLLAVEQPFANHNGGHLAFGPDGLLYIGLGDGGSAGDPQGNGQRLDTLLGKILRIDPRPDGDRPYTIPDGNPFAGRAGARPEIWAYGLRNPWRFTFDRQTGALWIADVGQNRIEEINAVDASAGGGQNYGWNRLEGTRRFSGAAPAGAVAPVYEYDHAGGNCSVTGGYVYRGERLPGLRGSFVFADYCRGEVLALVPDGSGLGAVPLGPRLDAVASFAQDGAGELYVLSLTSGLHRLEEAA